MTLMMFSQVDVGYQQEMDEPGGEQSESDKEMDTAKLVTQQNKKKKSGGFQSMGTQPEILDVYLIVLILVLDLLYEMKENTHTVKHQVTLAQSLSEILL